ncbi:MAG: VOC family protein [Deltaproteobacteria bacterium]|nr:VOC family protein [Deltaproteobacteria bacterium]
MYPISSLKEEVDAVMEEAGAAGARIVREAHDTFWGGYAGYFQDPDGHLWEVVWNPSLKITGKRKTYNIRHEVGIKASPEAVYEALTDTNGLAGWWTSDTRGNGSEVGGLLEFWFGDSCHKFEVVQLQAGKLVRWKARGEEPRREDQIDERQQGR